MYKRILRSISALLVFVMLLELLPAQLWEGIIQNARADGLASVEEGYDVPVVYESNNSIDAEIPPTVIDETEVCPDDDDSHATDGTEQGTAPDSEPALQQSNQSVQSDDSERLIALLKSHTYYSQLNATDASFLRTYTGISAAALIELETAGIRLANSLLYGQLALEFGCTVASIIDLAPSEDEYIALSKEIAIYKELLKEELTGTLLDQQLRGYLLQGYSCQKVFNAYGVSMTFGLSMDALLETNENEFISTELSASEIQQIQNFSDSLGVSAGQLIAYAAANNLSADELENYRDEIERKRADLIASPQGSSPTVDSETKAGTPPYLGAPYTYSSSDSEKVALNSGALIYETTDYVLPGVNGLDLVIGRRYNSQEASLYIPAVEETYYQYVEYTLVYGVNARWYISGQGWVNDLENSWRSKKVFNNIEDFVAFCSTLELPDLAEPCGDGVTYYMTPITEPTYCQYEGIICTSITKDNSYLNDTYGLGQGWSLQFSSIETIDSYKYLHLSDGRCYRADFSSSGSHLKDYLLTDLILEENCQEFSNGNVSSQYRLSYQDGQKEYFDNDGKLIGIQDRYGNTITLVHSTQNTYPRILITDTLDREIIISGQNNTAGHAMTVSLPDNVILTYQVDHQQENSQVQALAAYTNPVGKATHYSYTLQNAGFDIASKSTNGATNKYLNLTTITHPTSAQSVYTYQTSNRNLGSSGLAKIYRISSRSDHLGTEVVNQQTYTYSPNDCSGYPANSDPEELPNSFTYSTTVTNSNGVSTVVTFNNKHLQTQSLIKDAAGKRQVIAYSYDSNKLPIQKKVSTYRPGQQTPFVSITASTYDNKGRTTAHWSAQANGNKSNSAYKTSYTYDNAYGLPLMKQYRLNADTTIKIEYTLDQNKKNIIRTEVYNNNVLTGRTDYTYDSHGNVTSENRFHDDFVAYDLIEYAYQSNAFLIEEKHSGVLTANATNAVSTPGYSSGVIATKYTYDDLGRMTSLTDERGNTTDYTYDALGNVTQVGNPDNTDVSYNRNYVNNTVTVTDENGEQIKYTYTPLGLLYETVDVQTGYVISRNEYDGMSRLSKVSDFIYGAVTTYTYDALDRITSETVNQGSSILAQTLYDYHDAAENGQYQKVTKTIVGDQNAPSVVTTEYTDKTGNVVKTGKFLNGTEYFDTATYDYVGNVVSRLTAADAAKELPFTSEYEYNEYGQVTKAWNAENQYITNTYNALGQLISTTDYEGTPTSYTYDALGRLLTQTITIENGVTATSEYTYDASGNIIREDKPVNAVGETAAWAKTEYTYDSRNRLTKVQQYHGNKSASVTSYTYDGAGNMLTMSTGGDRTTTYTYDRYNNILTMTDALDQTESYAYSSTGKPLSKTDRNGQTTTYAFDALGRSVATTVGAEDEIQYTYTQTGQVRSEENNWQRTTYTYNALGQMTQVEEVELTQLDNTNCYRITLNANGGNVSPSYVIVSEGDEYDLPTPTRTGYAFSGWFLGNKRIVNGNAVEITDNVTLVAQWIANTYYITYHSNFESKDEDGTSHIGGQRVTCIYDEDVKIIENPFKNEGETFYGWSTSTVNSANRTIYQPGQIVRNLTSENNGTVHLYALWSDPQIEIPVPGPINPPVIASASPPAMAAAQSGGLIHYTKTYSYDLNGNRTSFQLEKDEELVQDVEYTYDSLNRLSTVTKDGTVEATYTYDTNGNRASLSYANGVTETYSYNKANWIVGLENKAGDTTLSSYSYTYYASGNQASKTSGGTVTSYTYDGLGRLTKESETNGLTVAYTYDSAGNRSRMAVTGTKVYTTNYTYDANNRLLTEAKTQGGKTSTTNYTYDGNGNTLSRVSGDGTTTYIYNGFNQLTILSVDGVQSAYAYNAQGIRTAKRANHTLTSYLLDGGDVVSEVQSGAVIGNYLRGVNLISWKYNTTTEYYLFNAHGDVVATTGTDGVVKRRYDYDAFGNEKGADTSSGGSFVEAEDGNMLGGGINPFRYCGEYWDRESGTYYLRARYYAPSIGRFTQQDTHWNTANMIYGDTPQKINEQEDALCLNAYSYAPQITAVMQAGNLYVYCVGNPLYYRDSSGYEAVVYKPDAVPIGAIYTGFHLEDLLNGLLGLGGFMTALFHLSDGSGYELSKSNVPTHSRTMGSATTAAPYVPTVTLSDLEEYLRTHLSAKVDTKRDYKPDKNVHHIVAKGAKGAIPARAILESEDVGLDTEIAENKVLISTRMHVHLHTMPYYNMINSIIANAYYSVPSSARRENIKNTLKSIGYMLESIDKLFNP